MRTSRVLLGLVLGRRLPQRDGVLRAGGAAGELVIRRDRWGVPHVDAQTEAVYQGDPAENPSYAPGLRIVIDPGGWQKRRWAVPGGQSGSLAFPHYDDQLSRYRNAEGVSISWAACDADTSALHTLRLQSTDTGSRPPAR